MTDGNQTYDGDYFVIYRNIELLCCAPGINIGLQVKYTSKTKKPTNIAKKVRFVVTRGRRWGEGGLDEGGQKSKGKKQKILPPWILIQHKSSSII